MLEQRGGTIVLKGAATLVGKNGELPLLCDRGNPGMAVPGMGDVLTGAVAGILAQSGRPFESAAAAACMHTRWPVIAAPSVESVVCWRWKWRRSCGRCWRLSHELLSGR